MVGAWDLAHRDAPRRWSYGRSSLRSIAEFMRPCARVEDWGCGGGALARFLEPGQVYVGVDGSDSPFADVRADLTEYRSTSAGIVLRHVLEHNLEWEAILYNALISFTDRLCVALFTPLDDDATHVMFTEPDFGNVPVISFRLGDLRRMIDPAVMTYSTRFVKSRDTYFGQETIIEGAATLMDWTVVIPFGGHQDPSRDRALRIVTTHLTRWHGWPIVLECDPAEEWSKGEVVDRAVARVQTEGIVVHDADVLVAPHWLAWSVYAVESGRPWSMPHATVHRMSRRGSMRQIVNNATMELGAPPPAGDLERRPHPAPVGGGIVVLTRRAYDLSGGIDPRFVGWGGEDISWGRALDTIVGPCEQGEAPLWHLWHPPQRSRLRGGRGSRDNERLASLYLDAVGDVVAMTRVVAR